jgi:hypothetical protein
MSHQKVDRRRGITLLTLSGFVWVTLAAPALAAVPVPAQQSNASPPAQSPLVISHDELPCVVTDLAPRVDAQVSPGPQMDKSYVYFKAAGTEDFYYTPMKGNPDNLEGVLPRPLPETKAIDYKVRARDVETMTKETREFVPPVVPGNACKVKGVAVPKEGAGLTIGLTKEGQNPVPPGFNKADIAYVILTTGAVVGIAAALKGGTAATAASGGGGAGAGGGSNTLLYVVGGAAVIGGAVAIANNNKSSSNTSTPTPPPTATATSTRTVTPTPTPIVSVIATATWSGLGDVDIQLLDPNGQSVGAPFPAGCESTAQRTERVLLQGPAPGNYRLMVSAKSCGIGTPSSIAAVVSVQSNSQPKCANSFVNVPVGGSPIQACTFSIP